MKKLFLNASLIVALAIGMTSCYTVSYDVGQGAQNGTKVSGKNNFVIGGLVPVGKQKSPEELAGGSKNYSVKVQMSFVDALLGAITGGIYTPTTTTVTK